MKLLSVGGLLASLTVIGGCTAAGVGPSENALNARLPTGVTLLESDQEQCAGDVQVEESVANRGAGLILQRGQNATFRVRMDDGESDVQWSCVSEASTEIEAVDCPTSTSYLRVTRADAGDELLLECYG